MSPHLVILSVDQCQLEFEFCGVNGEDPGAALSVQAVHVVPLHAGNVDRQVQGADDSMIPMPTHSTRDARASTTHLYDHIPYPKWGSTLCTLFYPAL